MVVCKRDEEREEGPSPIKGRFHPSTSLDLSMRRAGSCLDHMRTASSLAFLGWHRGTLEFRRQSGAHAPCAFAAHNQSRGNYWAHMAVKPAPGSAKVWGRPWRARRIGETLLILVSIPGHNRPHFGTVRLRLGFGDVVGRQWAEKLFRILCIGPLLPYISSTLHRSSVRIAPFL